MDNQRIKYLEQQIKLKKSLFQKENREQRILDTMKKYDEELKQYKLILNFSALSCLVVGIGSAIFLIYFVRPDSILMKSAAAMILIIAVYSFCISAHKMRELDHWEEFDILRGDTYTHAEDTVYRELIAEYDNMEKMKEELAELYSAKMMKEEKEEEKSFVLKAIYDPEDRDY